MARAFNVNGERSTFALSPITRQQIADLMGDLDMDAGQVVAAAVAHYHGWELGEKPFDTEAEIDDIKRRLAALEGK
jgi:hypothetical protein